METNSKTHSVRIYYRSGKTRVLKDVRDSFLDLFALYKGLVFLIIPPNGSENKKDILKIRVLT